MYATLSDANSLDPAWVYDSVSNAIVGNIYENLFMFDGAYTEKLIPLLATRKLMLLAGDATPSRPTALSSVNCRVCRGWT